MQEITKFFARFILTRWLLPYRCKNCGDKLEKFYAIELSPDLQKLHEEHGTIEIIDAFAYNCPNRCENPNLIIVM